MTTVLLSYFPRQRGTQFKKPDVNAISLLLARQLRTRSVDSSLSAEDKDLSFGLQRTDIVPFQISVGQAEQAFEAWHKKYTLSPTSLLQQATSPMRAAYLPFWLFRAQFEAHFSGRVGFKKDNKDTAWEEVAWRDMGIKSYDYTSSSMQVYASYSYRRDMVNALKSDSLLDLSEAVQEEDAKCMSAEGKLDWPEMRQSIAWSLACKHVRQQIIREAERTLVTEFSCTSTKDVQVRLKTLKRSARLIFLPAFILDYQYGEVFDAHGNRKPQKFQAFISGYSPLQIASERHFSPTKVQIGAGLATGGATGLAIMAGLHGQETFSLASSFLSALLVCTSAGLAARLAPEFIRQSAEDERIQVEDSDMEKVMSQGLGPQDVTDDKHELIRATTEWRRWEEANKWTWDKDMRRRWAESIWHRQETRKIRLKEYVRNKLRAEAKYKSEQENEARKRARYGSSSRQQTNPFSDGSGQTDFKGYYALLGLDGSLRGGISQAEIKAAYRKVALRWHPDKLQVDSEQDRERAYAQFAKVQRAYGVLQNKDSRSQYDSGTDPP